MKTTLSMTSMFFLFAALVSGGCGGGGGGGGNSEAGVAESPSPTIGASESSGAADSAYEVTVLGTLGGDSYAIALNNAGQVAGNYLGDGGETNAFLWDAGRMARIAPSSQAADINDQGEVVGWLEKATGPEAFVYDRGLFAVNSQDGTSKALALNNHGRIAGRLTITREYAFTELDGVMQTVAPDINGYAVAMNDGGQLILKQVLPQGFHALFYAAGSLTDLGTLGGDSTLVKGMNGAGQVVGASQVTSGVYHAFLWADGRMQDLGTFGGESSTALAINATGQVLLKVSGIDGDRFLLWENGTATPLGNFGSDYVEATDMNDRGQIVGWLMLETGEIRAFLATPK